MPEEAPGSVEETQETPESGPQEEAPASESPQDSPAEGSPDWEKRYNDMRPELDRRGSRIDQYETFIRNLQEDPQTMAALLQRLPDEHQAAALKAAGYELEGLEPEEGLDPEDELNQRLGTVEDFLREQQDDRVAAETQDLEEKWVNGEFGRLDPDKQLSAEERELIEARAFQRPDEDGIADIEAAYKAYQKALEVGTKRYRESKRAPKIETGQAGLEKVNLADDEERQQFMAAVMQAEAELES